MNDLKSKLVYYKNCLQKRYNEQLEYNLGIYFRKWDDFFPLEKKLIDLSYGKILDIGSCTGYYFPYLMDKGNALGIEVSSKINNIARKNGIYNNIVGDFFKYKFIDKFDTITLMGNDVAISGTLYRLKRMLKKFSQILNEKGQILLVIRHIWTLKYWHVAFTPFYNGQFGTPVKYLFLNAKYFKKIALKYGFHATVLGKDDSTGDLYYLIRLVKLS
jgi:SAM-dependent methyltransferase